MLPASLTLYSVMPAKAGIQGRAARTLPVALDSRCRGNDGSETWAGAGAGRAA